MSAAASRFGPYNAERWKGHGKVEGVSLSTILSRPYLMQREGAGAFMPRQSLARTPPHSPACVPASPEDILDNSVPPQEATPAKGPAAVAGTLPQPGEKRHLSSPEEVQEAVRRRIQGKRNKEVPPIGGLLLGQTASPAATPRQPQAVVDQLADAPLEQLAGMATASTQGIMEAVRSRSSKLNKDEIAAIGSHTERLSAVVTHLALRLAAAERRSAQLENQPRTSATLDATPTYASALKLPRRQETIHMVPNPGPMLAVYPAEESAELKTAEDTKAALKKAVDPTKLWVQVAKVRKVGNAGVLVQTTSQAAASRLKEAMPPTLRVAEPKRKQPLICLNRLEGNPTYEEVLTALHEQNLKDHQKWPLDRVLREAKGLFKKTRSQGAAIAAVFSCTTELREELLQRGTVYIGWQAVEVTDYVDVTCCNRCQQFGHPEKYCRAAEVTCSRCGITGHKSDACQSTSACCATCKRFGRKEAASHRTAARDCPARLYAEKRSVAMTNYGF